MGLKEKIAIDLANAAAKQLEQEGYKNVLEGHIQNSILDSDINPNSLRMQFRLPKGKQYQQEITHVDGSTTTLFPRRILTTIQTPYQRSAIMKYLVEIEEKCFLGKIRGYDSQLVCRHFRMQETTGNLLSVLQERGVDYVLMCTLTTDLIDPEGRNIHDKSGKPIECQRNPVFILPEATPEEIQTANEFCKKYQIPNQEAIDRLTGIID